MTDPLDPLDPLQTNYNDERIHDNAQPVVIIKNEQPKEPPWWKQPAVCVAVLAVLIAFWAEREARLGEYYAIDLEIKMSQAGLHPPPDPWGKSKESKP